MLVFLSYSLQKPSHVTIATGIQGLPVELLEEAHPVQRAQNPVG